mmetsp:Transcript_28272/g.38920  ORF Transcript_28272/g.38920 Transcript_28272/m.38920 type:complete len:218 (-) Transcript_28272:1-654(-)
MSAMILFLQSVAERYLLGLAWYSSMMAPLTRKYSCSFSSHKVLLTSFAVARGRNSDRNSLSRLLTEELSNQFKLLPLVSLLSSFLFLCAGSDADTEVVEYDLGRLSEVLAPPWDDSLDSLNDEISVKVNPPPFGSLCAWIEGGQRSAAIFSVTVMASGTTFSLAATFTGAATASLLLLLRRPFLRLPGGEAGVEDTSMALLLLLLLPLSSSSGFSFS